jgi:hypothetical protein
VATYNPSVHAASVQDIANDAPPLVVSCNVSCKFFGDHLHLRGGLLGAPQLFPQLVAFNHFLRTAAGTVASVPFSMTVISVSSTPSATSEICAGDCRL